MADTAPVSRHVIAGTELTMPVRVRRARQRTAMFAVAAGAAQAMIDYSGLRVFRLRPGKAVVVLMLMHYTDSDLGQYFEYGTNVMVNPPGQTLSGPRRLAEAGAFIHHLPVDQDFTLEAGRTIWGYPKVRAAFAVRGADEMAFNVSHDGRLIADLPGHYLNWFAREGFPPGEIGRLLALMQEIDHNGLSELLTPLRQRQPELAPGRGPDQPGLDALQLFAVRVAGGHPDGTAIQ